MLHFCAYYFKRNTFLNLLNILSTQKLLRWRSFTYWSLLLYHIIATQFYFTQLVSEKDAPPPDYVKPLHC